MVKIELRNVPGNVVVTTDLPEYVHVSLRDKGSALLAYRYTRRLKAIVVDYNNYTSSNGHVIIQGSELTRQIASQLLPTTQMMSFKPETLEFYYNYGLCKRVPVRIQGSVRTNSLYSLSNTLLDKDSVLVYASKEILDTITGAYTQALTYRELTDTVKANASFVKLPGVKFVPSRIHVTFCVDRLVEKTVQVPVQQVNFPASKQLRTFPATVSVTFQVPMGQYRLITEDNFVLVVNYEDLLRNTSNQCHLSLKTIPAGVSHVKISPQDVEYIIEDLGEETSNDE